VKRLRVLLLSLSAVLLLAATSYFAPYSYTYDGANWFNAYQTGASDIGSWQLEGNFTNWLNNGVPLVAGGSSAFTSVAGQVGNSCAGPLGGSPYVQMGAAMQSMGTPTAFSFAMQFKYTTADAYYWSGIIESANSEEIHFLVNASNVAQVRLFRGSPFENAYTGTTTLTLNNWYRVYIEYTTGGQLKLNVAGTTASYAPVTSFSITPSNNWRIGSAYNADNSSGGYFDDVRLQARVWTSGEQAAYMAGTLDGATSPLPTNTPTNTLTYTPTPVITPTLAAQATPCGNPFPSAVWTNVASNPLFVPTTTPEANVNYEPSVVQIGSTYFMSNTAGWSSPFTELSTSSDGLNWGARTPITGAGYGGYAGYSERAKLCIIRNALGQDAPTLYFSDAFNIRRATSADGYPPYATQNIALPDNAIADASSGFQNVGIYQDLATPNIVVMLAEGNSASMGNWELYPAISTDYGVTFAGASGAGTKPLADLAVQGIGASCARSIYKSSTTGLYHIWYHQANTIWHASSSQFPYRWKVDTNYTNHLISSMWGITSVDQLVDPCVLQVGDHVNLYCDATANGIPAARLGVFSTGPMSLESFFACSVLPPPTPTPTPAPSVSISPGKSTLGGWFPWIQGAK